MYTPQPTYIPTKGVFHSAAVVHPPDIQTYGNLDNTRYILTPQNVAEKEGELKYRIMRELKTAGVTSMGLKYSEVRLLPKVLHPEEHIEAVVYGKYEGGLAMLVATNLRVLFLDKKPLFIKSDELTFDIVGGVSYTRSALFGTIVLHSRIGDFSIKTLNFKAAAKFREFIEHRCLEHRYTFDTDSPFYSRVGLNY